MTIDRQSEDEGRVHHRRADLASQGVELLELEGDPVERLLEAARALARARPSTGRAGRRSSGWRSIASASELPASTSSRTRRWSPPSAARPRSGPRACRASAASACRRRSGSRTGARRRRGRAWLTLLKRSKQPLELQRLALLGDVEDDQPPLAELLGDLRLGVGLELAPRRDRRRRRRRGRRRCSSAGLHPARRPPSTCGVVCSPPSRRFSSSGTAARCSARERVILPRRTSCARWASIVCIPIAPEVWIAE